MSEINPIPTTTSTTKKVRRFGRATEIIIFVVVIAAILVLVKILTAQLSLKHEVSAGRVVTDKAIAALQKQDATTAHNLGDAAFQANPNNSIANLTSLFAAAHSHVTGTPLVVKQSVANDKSFDTVSIIYKFNGKETFYIRAMAGREAGKNNWQLINLSGNSSENELLTSE